MEGQRDRGNQSRGESHRAWKCKRGLPGGVSGRISQKEETQIRAGEEGDNVGALESDRHHDAQCQTHNLLVVGPQASGFISLNLGFLLYKMRLITSTYQGWLRDSVFGIPGIIVTG